jgi:hypothetical protein
MGLPPIAAQTRTASTISAWAIKPVRALAVFGLQHFGDQITSLYKRSEWARRIMKEAEARIRKAPTTGEFGLYGKHVSYATDKARTILGYVPAVDMARGTRLSVAWLRHSDFVDSDSVSAS